MKRQTLLDDLVKAPDRTKIIRIVKADLSETKGVLAIVIHENKESCLLFMEESDDPSMPPVVSKVLPIYSDLKIEITQANTKAKKADLLVTFTLKDDSASILFQDRTNMTDVISETRSLISNASPADGEKHDPAKGHFDWIKPFFKYGYQDQDQEQQQQQQINDAISSNNKKKTPTRSNSMPIEPFTSPSALRYVLPLKREDTIAKINLKRTRTVLNRNERVLSWEAARQHYLNFQLKEREDEFVDWKKITVFSGTWNVHGSAPTSSLKAWLQDTLKTEDGKPINDPDFYVIGLQEMETNRDAYIRYDPTKEKAWVKTILESLKDGGKDYYRVESYQLVTMLLIVIAKEIHRPFITEVEKTYAGVGLMNVLANKGGVAIRLRFHDSYLCFVTSHLAAFMDKTERRNQDFTELSKRLLFNHNYTEKTSYVSYSWNDGGDEGVTFLENMNVIKDWRSTASIYHNDYLIWCGDLNYRINQSELAIKSRLRQNKLDLLCEYDQLTIERSAGRAFPMFEEGKITFEPTYKYDTGTDRYDTSEKRRAPAWTDRVLWKKDKPESKHPLELITYQNCKKMMMSDHKPVQAIMALDIRSINEDLQIKTLTELNKQLSNQNQDQQPYGEISSSYVDFGQVQFMEYKERHLTLTNTGRVLTYFRFIPKIDETTTSPNWLTVSPLSGVIAPGEKVMIRFEIMVDPTNATPFNLKQEKLDDVLILHLENSRDFFISVTGDYQTTCFGTPLDKLTEMSVPISSSTAQNIIRRSAASAAAAAAANDRGNNQQEQPSIPNLNQIDLPKALWKIMNFLWNENMFKMESLFLEHGDINIASYIRKCLDNGEPFDTSILLGDSQQLEEQLDSPVTIINNTDDSDDDGNNNDADEKKKLRSKEAKSSNAMIDVLIAFLDCLPEPVIKTELYVKALEAAKSPEMMDAVKDSLDMFHRNVLLYIGMFLRQAIDRSPTTCRAKREAAIVENFTVLLRPPVDYKERNPVEAKEKREMFISQLLKSLV